MPTRPPGAEGKAIEVVAGDVVQTWHPTDNEWNGYWRVILTDAEQTRPGAVKMRSTFDNSIYDVSFDVWVKWDTREAVPTHIV